MIKTNRVEKKLLTIAFILSLVLGYQVWTEDTKLEIAMLNEISGVILIVMLVLFFVAIGINIYGKKRNPK